MSLTDVIVAILLALTVVVTLISVVGLVAFRDLYQRLHFVTPGAVVAPILVGLAVLVKESFNVRGLQTILTVAAMVVLGPILSHATARAARVRNRGDWRQTTAKEGRG